MPKRRKAQKKPNELTQAELNQGLEQAAISGDLAAFNDFLQRGASLDASEAGTNMLVTAGAQPAIRDLLTNPANGLYKQFNDGTTDLHLAAIRGDYETIESIFTENPERMLELTTRGESVLNWANYFMRHQVISFLLSHQAFEDKLKQEQTDDAYYDLARGHELLADYFVQHDYLDDVEMYYEIAIEFYGLMREGSNELVSQINTKLADFKERYPMAAPECDSEDAASTRAEADEGAVLSPYSSDAEAGNPGQEWNALWNPDLDGDNDAVPYNLVRQGAVADLRLLSGTVQPAESVQVILQAEAVKPAQMQPNLMDDVWAHLDEALEMVEDGLISLEATVKRVGTDFVEGLDVAGVRHDISELQQAAISLGAEAAAYLDELGAAASSVVAQLPVSSCLYPASTPELEMQPSNEATVTETEDSLDKWIAELAAASPSLSLSLSPISSRSSSTASLGLTGLFAPSVRSSSPANAPEGPEPLGMFK